MWIAFVEKIQLKDWYGSYTTSGPLGIDVVPKTNIVIKLTTNFYKQQSIIWFIIGDLLTE